MTAKPALSDIIVVMSFDPLGGIAELDRHLASMKARADANHYPFNRHMVRNELQAATFRLRFPRQVRLLLGPSGALSIEISPLVVAKDGEPRL
ncbi:hypothetical protein [Sphingomonas sp.]|uniref:hypothetical protein n=1 Tax=Sphingomonas sp. TaxID=28214 RepID=UPI002CE10ABC|nr:hypothetical protein [Sphingomonas sp.]HWK37170.1 hypothetical protein [Sphingomonas sp.]